MACQNYAIDVTAANFGQCKCGHEKAGHVILQTPVKGQTSAVGKVTFTPVDKAATGACGRYAVDMAAESFGACKCGHTKASHALRTPPKAAGRAQFVAVAKDATGACDSYAVDMAADMFGICK